MAEGFRDIVVNFFGFRCDLIGVKSANKNHNDCNYDAYAFDHAAIICGEPCQVNRRLNVDVTGEFRVVLNKLETRLGIFTHEAFNKIIDIGECYLRFQRVFTF